MSRRMLALAAAVAVLGGVVIVGAILARDTGPAPAVPSSGASDSLRVDGTDIVTGKEISLEQFDGKPVVLTIWASWCPGCNAEGHTLARFAKGHPEAGFFGVDFQDTKGAARSFYQRVRLALPERLRPGRPDRG
jgi:thiol-disulfide isomerase/thioredoxin